MVKYDDNLTKDEGLALVIPERERRRTRTSHRGQAFFFWRMSDGNGFAHR